MFSFPSFNLGTSRLCSYSFTHGEAERGTSRGFPGKELGAQVKHGEHVTALFVGAGFPPMIRMRGPPPYRDEHDTLHERE